MKNVIQLPVVTTLNLDADMTLNSLQGKLEGSGPRILTFLPFGGAGVINS